MTEFDTRTRCEMDKRFVGVVKVGNTTIRRGIVDPPVIVRVPMRVEGNLLL